MDVSGVIMQKIMSLIREEHGKTGYLYWLNGGPAMKGIVIAIIRLYLFKKIMY
jgi:hypothetical protein